MTDIPTWRERAMAHPDHQSGMISEEMLRARMGEEIADLRSAVERLTRERDEARGKEMYFHEGFEEGSKTAQWEAAENARLRVALQEATLAAHGCAQCRDEIGRICREALEAKP